MLKLGDMTLPVPFFQAALSGYSDRAMRTLGRKFGAPLTFSGVMLDKTACHQPLFRKPNFNVLDHEHPIGGQILGTEPEMMARAARTLCEVGYDLIDINVACPAPKVLRRGRGGSLLKDPQRTIEIFRRVRTAVSCPVLMKLRAGFDKSAESMDNFWQICELAAREGIDALIVHGRSVRQMYRGKADWQILKELKKRYPSTTIIGSGDLFEAGDIVEKMKTSGIDGVVIARGAIGNPWLFRSLNALLCKTADSVPDLAEQGEVILEHFDMICELYDSKRAVRYFRKFLAGDCKLRPNRKETLLTLMSAETDVQLRDTIKELYM